ncbi:MAG: hypothetical protein OXG71_08655 [Rhodospirillales bacterium]|nr:hypothetical protein [Rhodospirillales bacterium]
MPQDEPRPEARMELRDWIDAGTPIALCIGTLSVSVWLSFAYDNPEWFQRAGSVVVCLSVWLEIQQLLAKAPVATRVTINDRSVFVAPDVPKARKALHLIAWGGLFVGTLIWGYGDLLFRFIS